MTRLGNIARWGGVCFGTDLPQQSLGTNVTGIAARPDLRGTLELIFRVQPETRRTVKLHRTSITTRLNVHSVAELTRMVQEAGVFQGPTDEGAE